MQKKDKIVSTRITKDELNFLIKKSSFLQLSVSNYIRLLIQIKKDTDEKIIVFNQSY